MTISECIPSKQEAIKGLIISLAAALICTSFAFIVKRLHRMVKNHEKELNDYEDKIARDFRNVADSQGLSLRYMAYSVSSRRYALRCLKSLLLIGCLAVGCTAACNSLESIRLSKEAIPGLFGMTLEQQLLLFNWIGGIALGELAVVMVIFLFDLKRYSHNEHVFSDTFLRKLADIAYPKGKGDSRTIPP